MRVGTLALAAAFLAASFFLLMQGWAMPPSVAANDVGPGQLPIMVGIVGIVLSIILIVQTWLESEPEGFEHGYSARGWAFLLLSAVSILAVYWIDYVIVAAVYVFVGALIISGRPALLTALVGGIGFAAFLQLVFRYLLGVPLP